MEVKCSLRVRKVRGQDVEVTINHNARTRADVGKNTYPKSSDPDRVQFNKGYINRHFSAISNEDDLISVLRQKYLEAKMHGLLPANTRFPRCTTSAKQKNGKRENVPTAYMSEIILQVGSDGHISLPNEVYKDAGKNLTKIMQNTLLRIDIHRDEISEHVHYLFCNWSIDANRFNNWFKQKDSYEKLQNEMNHFMKTLLSPFDLEVLPIQKKRITGKEHIPHKMFKRYIEPVEEQLVAKRDELEKLEHRINQTLNHENILRSILEDKVQHYRELLKSESQGIFGTDVLERYENDIREMKIAAALTFLEMEEGKNTDEQGESHENFIKR